jgi:hypothetical protein
VSRRRRRGVQVSRRAAVAARGRPLAGAGTEGNSRRFSAIPEPFPPRPVMPAPRSPGFRAARRGAHKGTLLAATGSVRRAPRAWRAIRQAGLGPDPGIHHLAISEERTADSRELAAAMAGGSGKATYYAVLGVARDASAAEIRSAWRRLSLVSARRRRPLHFRLTMQAARTRGGGRKP